MRVRAQVTGWGKYVPEQILSNEELSHMVETSDEWIRSRTGIAARRIAGTHETTASMAIRAARQALEVAGLAPLKLDLVIVATATPDHVLPPTACLVQDALGAAHAGAFDLGAGCTGFVYALSVAAEMIAAGTYHNILVVGAETLSRIVNWQDRNTCVLFGDGAGAVVLQPGNGGGGVLASTLGADGSGGNLLTIPAGGSALPTGPATIEKGQHYIHMDGREVYRFATRVVARAAREVTEAAGLRVDDIDLLVPHQANVRIIDSAIKQLGIARERVYVNLQRYGNTSAASIPIALCEAVDEGRLQPGDHAVLVGFGAGLTWGAVLLRWGIKTPLPPVPRWRRFFHWTGYRLAALRSLAMRVARKVDAWLGEPLNGKKG